MAGSADLHLLLFSSGGLDFDKVVQDLVDISLGKLLERMVGLDFAFDIKKRGDSGFFRQLITLGTFLAIESQVDMFELVVVLELFDFLLHVVVVRQEDDHGTGLAFTRFGDCSVELPDQTGQGVVRIASENESDGFATKLSDKTVFFAAEAGSFSVKHIKRVKRCHAFARLWTGFDIACQREGGTACHHSQRSEQRSQHHGSPEKRTTNPPGSLS